MYELNDESVKNDNQLSLMDFGQAVGLKLNPENRFEGERA
jgi:hypothetical protein